MQHFNGVRSSLPSGLPFTLFCESSSQGASSELFRDEVDLDSVLPDIVQI